MGRSNLQASDTYWYRELGAVETVMRVTRVLDVGGSTVIVAAFDHKRVNAGEITGGDAQPGITAALDQAESDGIERVYLPPNEDGTEAVYTLEAFVQDGGFKYHLLLRPNVLLEVPEGVTLRTSQADVRIFALIEVGTGWGGQPVDALVGTYTRGGQSITLATAADAGNYSAGDWILIRTGQTLASGNDNPIGEYNRVVTADAGTGVITLEYPLRNDYAVENYPEGHVNEGAPAPYGILKVTVLDGSGIVGGGTIENIHAAPTAPLIYGNQVVKFQWGGTAEAPMTLRSATGVMSLGMSRSTWHHLRIYAGDGYYGLTQDKCNHDWSIEDVRIEASAGVAEAHFHEGCSGTVRDLTVIADDPNGNANLVSIRARAHHITFDGLTTEGQSGGLWPSIYAGPSTHDIALRGVSDTHLNPSRTSVRIAGFNSSFEGESNAIISIEPGRGNTLNGVAV